MRQRSRGVDECVSPIVFTQFHPSNKSFKRGIREKGKSKAEEGCSALADILYSTAVNLQ